MNHEIGTVIRYRRHGEATVRCGEIVGYDTFCTKYRVRWFLYDDPSGPQVNAPNAYDYVFEGDVAGTVDRPFTFTVTVTCQTRGQAQQVIAERLGGEAEYGFNYEFTEIKEVDR